MAGILDTILGGLTKQYDIAMPAVNFVRGLALGPKEALMTPSMQLDLARRAENKGGDKGALGYEDFGLDVTQPMGRFTGGLFSLDPTAFANVGSVGRVTYEKDPTQFGGYKYGSTMFDFTPDKDTGSTGNKILDFINEGGLAQKLANLNLSNTLSNLAFTPAYGDIPTKEERQGIESFDNLVSDTVIAQPKSQFQDYPGDKNLGFDYNFDENVLKEEEDAQYNLDNKGSFNFDGILQSLGGFAKDAAGRYIGSQALGGAGTMIGGPVVGGIAALAGLLGGRGLFNSPYIGAGAYTMDQYGNMYTADQLNKMNARGGYYSEPARDSRRRDQSIRRMEQRKAEGLKFGINRLAQLKEQQRQEEVSRQSAVDDYFGGSDAGADKGRFDGATSRSEYDANPTGYSGPF
jgi:hypothetical protein